ncbi:hypothetical protein HDV01_005942 [Terramyces sp. JEL0728]|nr:hypothetical protein HDV01_005942 [Terramyces sp. JEL0728]
MPQTSAYFIYNINRKAKQKPFSRLSSSKKEGTTYHAQNKRNQKPFCSLSPKQSSSSKLEETNENSNLTNLFTISPKVNAQCTNKYQAQLLSPAVETYLTTPILNPMDSSYGGTVFGQQFQSPLNTALTFEDILQTEFPMAAMSPLGQVPISHSPSFGSVGMARDFSVASTAGKVAKKRREHYLNHQELLAEVEEKRRRNTESARRSRARKLERTYELERLLAESEQARQEMAKQLADLVAEKQQWQQQKREGTLTSEIF